MFKIRLLYTIYDSKIWTLRWVYFHWKVGEGGEKQSVELISFFYLKRWHTWFGLSVLHESFVKCNGNAAHRSHSNPIPSEWSLSLWLGTLTSAHAHWSAKVPAPAVSGASREIQLRAPEPDRVGGGGTCTQNTAEFTSKSTNSEWELR